MKRFYTFFVTLFVFNSWFSGAFAQTVRVPDANLAAVLREALGLESGATLTRQALQGLTQLNAQSREISDLTGLEQASQLQRLFLSDNEISDITPLKNMTRLEALGIWENQIHDITPLENLKQLEALSIWDNEIHDITPLENLTRLNWLDLGINQISNITALRSLTRLEVLLILRNRIRDVTPLRSLTRLEELDFSDNQVHDLLPIAGLERLEVLYANSNQITNIAPLSKLIRLEKLRLASNQIQDVASLVELERLTELQLAENPIRNLSRLEPLIHRNPNLVLDVDISQPVVAAGIDVPTMYWVATDSGTLHRLRGSQVEDLAPSVTGVTGLVVDATGGKLYWTQKAGGNKSKVQRANLDGTNIQLIQDLLTPSYGIALDSVAGKLYRTNNFGKIQRMNLDGSNLEPNLITGLESPMDIALDVVKGKIYWTEADGNIRYADVDGRNMKTLATVDAAGGIAVAGNKVYWTEGASNRTGRIWQANLDGTNAKRLLALEEIPQDVAVDTIDGKVYWTDAQGRIQRANLNGKRIENVVTNLVSPGTLVYGTYSAADVNQDGTVDNIDLKFVAIALIAEKSPPANPRTDIDSNGIVDFIDLVLVIAAFDEAADAAPPAIRVELSALGLDQDQIQALIDRLDVTDNHSLAVKQTLVYLQELLTLETSPVETALLANYPNPFNPETWIPYHLANPCDVAITIYNTQGAVVRKLDLGHQRAGYYTTRSRAAYWDGKNAVGERVSSGIYFYQLQADNLSLLQKMLILK